MARKKTPTAPAADANEQTARVADADVERDAVAEPAPVAATTAPEDEKAAQVLGVLPPAALAPLTPAVRFVTPFGGRFAADGLVAQLPPGSIVSAATHDMEAIVAAGIQLLVAD